MSIMWYPGQPPQGTTVPMPDVTNAIATTSNTPRYTSKGTRPKVVMNQLAPPMVRDPAAPPSYTGMGQLMMNPYGSMYMQPPYQYPYPYAPGPPMAPYPAPYPAQYPQPYPQPYPMPGQQSVTMSSQQTVQEIDDAAAGKQVVKRTTNLQTSR